MDPHLGTQHDRPITAGRKMCSPNAYKKNPRAVLQAFFLFFSSTQMSSAFILESRSKTVQYLLRSTDLLRANERLE